MIVMHDFSTVMWTTKRRRVKRGSSPTLNPLQLHNHEAQKLDVLSYVDVQHATMQAKQGKARYNRNIRLQL